MVFDVTLIDIFIIITIVIFLVQKPEVAAGILLAISGFFLLEIICHPTQWKEFVTHGVNWLYLLGGVWAAWYTKQHI